MARRPKKKIISKATSIRELEVPIDVGDEKQVTKRKSKAKLARDREVEELRQLVHTEGGRAFIWRILEQCGVYQIGYQGDVNDAIFNEGRRSIGIWALSEVFISDPQIYTIMRNEAASRDTRKGN